MMRARWVIGGCAALLLVVSAAFAIPPEFKLGLTILKAGVQPGYIVYRGPDGIAYAVDVQGQVVRKWTAPDANADMEMGYTRPLPNGNLLARLQSKRQPGRPSLGTRTVVEMTQAGRVVWSYSDTERALHHDFERLANGNTLVVCAKDLHIAAISSKTLKDDCLIEVDSAGKIV